MKILIVTQYFWPEQFRINDVVKSLLEKGHSVDVLTGEPNYPHGEFFKEYIENKNKYNKFISAQIFRIPIIKRGKAGPVRLFLNYISFIISSIFIGTYKLRKKKYNVILTFATSPITVALPAIFISFIKNAKHVLWVLDIWPHILKELKIVNNKFLINFLNVITNFIYHKSDIILAQSRGFKKIISNTVENENKVHYFPSWSEDLKRNENKINKNISLGLSKYKNKFNIVFTGNVGEAQNFDNVIEAANILKYNNDIQWLIVGSGRKLTNLKAIVAQKNINNFNFIGHVEISEISAFHNLATILLVSLSPGEFLSCTVPGKLQTYMSSNKFILGFLNGDGAREIYASKTGTCINPARPELLAQKILELKNSPEIIKRVTANNFGPKFIDKYYNKTKILNELSNYFDNSLEEFKIIKNVKSIPYDRNFSLSGLNLAFLGFWVKGQIKISKDVYLWSDGFFYKRFFNQKFLNKIPGRDLINNLQIPESIQKIFVIGNLESKAKVYLEELYKKEIIHVPLDNGPVPKLYEVCCNIQFSKNDLIILTLPTPKQEEFAALIMKNKKFYKILCVGGAINMSSGLEKPVPNFIEKLNLEFLWRLRTDTTRRLKRLCISALHYVSGEFFFKFKNINKKIIDEE